MKKMVSNGQIGMNSAFDNCYHYVQQCLSQYVQSLLMLHCRTEPGDFRDELL
jgi:hypothetical protein